MNTRGLNLAMTSCSARARADALAALVADVFFLVAAKCAMVSLGGTGRRARPTRGGAIPVARSTRMIGNDGSEPVSPIANGHRSLAAYVRRSWRRTLLHVFLE